MSWSMQVVRPLGSSTQAQEFVAYHCIRDALEWGEISINGLCHACFTWPRDLLIYACLLPLQLRRIQCTFVLKMLESSTFNKLLSGVRECNKLLKEAATLKRSDKEQFRALIRWFEEHDIVQRILRTNLHQKQYVQEVRGWAGLCVCAGCRNSGSSTDVMSSARCIEVYEVLCLKQLGCNRAAGPCASAGPCKVRQQ